VLAYNHVSAPRFLVELIAANHLSVVDDCTPFCVAEDISQEEAHRLVLRYAVPFLQRYLARRSGSERRLTETVPGVNLTGEPIQPLP
jgi:hypothetical protein